MDWEIADAEWEGALFFTKQGGDNEDSLRVWIWESPERKKYTSQIQNLLFSLAVIESREPLDVGNAMIVAVAETVVASEATVTSEKPVDEIVFRFSVRNEHDETITCRVQEGAAGDFSVDPGDALEFEIQGPSATIPNVVYTRDRIEVTVASGCELQVLQGVALAPQGKSVTEHVRAELQRARLDDITRQKVLDELQPVLTRADFELDVDGENTPAKQTTTQRQAAIVASALAKKLPAVESSPAIVWHVTARLLATADLRLILNSSSVEDFFKIATSDDELAPIATAAWLKEFSRG